MWRMALFSSYLVLSCFKFKLAELYIMLLVRSRIPGMLFYYT